MEDRQIISLLWERSEIAIKELEDTYGNIAYHVAKGILSDRRDVEECVNDAYMRLWNAIPPKRPKSLRAYLASVVRNIALDKYAYNHAQKRSVAIMSAFEELDAILPANNSDGTTVIEHEVFQDFMKRFLRGLKKEARVFFVRRYWYGESIRDIADAYHVKEERVRTSLFRTRNQLKSKMEKEGMWL